MQSIRDLKDIIMKQDLEIKMLRRLLINKHDNQPSEVDGPFRDENEQLVEDISKITGISVGHIMGKSRKIEIATARFACFWGLYHLNQMTYSGIGRMFNLHHSSIMYGIKVFEERSELKQNIEYQLIREIQGI
jgi:chromosomal replication initiation ATPase DnaA